MASPAAVSLSLAQTDVVTFQELDANGNVLASPIAPDAPPTYQTDTPSVAGVVAAADGLSAVLTPVAVGVATITVTGVFSGQSFSSSGVATVTAVVVAGVAGLQIVFAPPTP